MFDKAKAIRYEQPKNCILFRRQNLFHTRLKKESAKKKKGLIIILYFKFPAIETGYDFDVVVAVSFVYILGIAA